MTAALPNSRPSRVTPSCESLDEAHAAARCAADPPPCALKLFDDVPRGCLVHHASDDSAAPLIRAGEIAIVDPSDRRFVEVPGLFLICWASRGPERYATRRFSFALREVHAGRPPNDDLWWASPYNRPRSRAAVERDLSLSRSIAVSDGLLSAVDMIDQVVGRVIGIYAPSRMGDPS